jgi:hypothetical protein
MALFLPSDAPNYADEFETASALRTAGSDAFTGNFSPLAGTSR